MSQSDLEKTEQATPRRIEKARKEGNVPRSKELSICTGLLAAGTGLWIFGGRMNTSMKENLASGLSLPRAMAYDPMLLLASISKHIESLLYAFAPLAALLFVVAIASPALIGGWNFSTKSIGFRLSRVNPVSGFSNILSKNSLVELVKSILKAGLVGTIGYLVVAHDFPQIMSLTLTPIEAGISHVAEILIKGFLMIVASLVLIALIDVPFQLYKYNSKLKMSKQEIKNEAKESDGNPEIKAKIRQQQREMAKNRMMSAIPNADVVITNPTHYAVAIKYSEDSMAAPVVVAKGSDEIALKIREIAAEHHIVTMESPKLARALFAHTEIDEQIPEALYPSVAQVLSYVFQLRAFNKAGGIYPEKPTSTDVPDALDPHFELKGA